MLNITSVNLDNINADKNIQPEDFGMTLIYLMTLYQRHSLICFQIRIITWVVLIQTDEVGQFKSKKIPRFQ